MNDGAVQAAPWLAALFPPGVRVAWAEIAGASAADLYPEEAACLGPQVVARRRSEFSAGRLCARRVLAELGIRNFPLLPAADRSPIWPWECIGSLSHSQGLALAVAARRGKLLALGVDVEDPARIGRELWPLLTTPEELARLEQLPTAAQNRFAALCFSAKEAFYKCQYPLTGHWLGFADVALEGWEQEKSGEGGKGWESGESGELGFRVLAADWPGQPWRFRGRYLFRQGRLFCGVWAEAAEQPERETDGN